MTMKDCPTHSQEECSAWAVIRRRHEQGSATMLSGDAMLFDDGGESERQHAGGVAEGKII